VLVEAKYAAIAFLDNDQEAAAGGAIELRETLRVLAAKSDISTFGDYPPIHEAKLLSRFIPLSGPSISKAQKHFITRFYGLPLARKILK
jgi:hypothetical protein